MNEEKKGKLKDLTWETMDSDQQEHIIQTYGSYQEFQVYYGDEKANSSLLLSLLQVTRESDTADYEQLVSRLKSIRTNSRIPERY